MNETDIPREIDWLIGDPDGDVWIVGRTGNGFCAPDDPAAKSWTVLGQIGTNTSFSEKFDTREFAEARANEARSTPYHYMEKVLRGLELHDWESDMARNALAGEWIRKSGVPRSHLICRSVQPRSNRSNRLNAMWTMSLRRTSSVVVPDK